MADAISDAAATISGNAVGDEPTCEDSLGFLPYVEAITAFLTSTATQPPLTMSIEGEWGSGKSSFMLQLERAIRGPSKADVFFQNLPRSMGGFAADGSLLRALHAAWKRRPQITVQFNAWRHDKQDALWAAFALQFGKSLRKQVGFVRGWRGDLSLFYGRLPGFRGWMELLLLVISIVLFLVSFVSTYHYATTRQMSDIRQLISFLNGNESGQSDRFYEVLLRHGSLGILLAIGIAGFSRFHKQIKLPISINIERYLSKPNYRGRISFIESFHEDFARMVRAYAKYERIYVFVDDLDRCDVPRAAELMQALNLMISSAGSITFILGMDREKVAAGIAQKYKDLLPFLSDKTIASSTSHSNPLYFGYSYLEKFIQLSFTLPVLRGRDSLRQFLSMIDRQSVHSVWTRRLVQHWTERVGTRLQSIKYKSADTSPLKVSVSKPAPGSDGFVPAVEQAKRVKQIRVKVAKDSDRIIDVIGMVTGLLDNNPRRLKQFVNTYRMALFLSSNQGLLDQEDGEAFLTPEQLGKYVAIILKYPEIRPHLAKDFGFLYHLQNQAVSTDPARRSAWVADKRLSDLLAYGVVPNSGHFPSDVYSLEHFPAEKLFSILPNVPERPGNEMPESMVGESGVARNRPVTTYGDLLIPFEQLAAKYEEIRGKEPASNDRTVKMTSIFQEARQHAKILSAETASKLLAILMAKDNDGARLMTLAIAAEHRQQSSVPWLLRVLDEYRSWFEHYNSIRTMLNYSEFLAPSDCKRILSILNSHSQDIAADRGRASIAEQLREATEQWIGEKSSDSTPEGPNRNSVSKNTESRSAQGVNAKESGLQISDAQQAARVASKFADLNSEEREIYPAALELLLAEGSASDYYLIRELRKKGLASNWAGVLPGMKNRTNLIRAVPGQPERTREDEREWQIRPELQDAVRAYLSVRKTSAGSK